MILLVILKNTHHSDIDHFLMQHLLIQNICIILDRVTLVVSLNDSQPVVNEDRLGISIHYININ